MVLPVQSLPDHESMTEGFFRHVVLPERDPHFAESIQIRQQRRMVLRVQLRENTDCCGESLGGIFGLLLVEVDLGDPAEIGGHYGTLEFSRTDVCVSYPLEDPKRSVVVVHAATERGVFDHVGKYCWIGFAGHI